MDIEDVLSITTAASPAIEKLSDDTKIQDTVHTVAAVASSVKPIKAVAGATAIGAAVSSASGAGIMSTLATAGAALGGGVVAGVGAVAGGAGAGIATLLNKTVLEDSTEAKVGSYAGAAVGTVGSLSALAVAGAGPAGLASIGSIVGGGMAAGTPGVTCITRSLCCRGWRCRLLAHQERVLTLMRTPLVNRQ
jgi:hypothetical protein